MEDIWRRIERWLEANTPSLLETLRPGATDADITETQKTLGIVFPDDVRASFRIHDGANDMQLLNVGEFLSLTRIIDEWTVWKDLLDDGTFAEFGSEPRGPIRSDWWNAKWIPLTSDGSGNNLCLDLDPPSDGQMGQIITMWHDAGDRAVVAPNIRQFLETFADDLESGQYTFSEEYDCLMRSDEL